MGSNDNLENLARSGVLKPELPDRKECEGLLRSAIDRLKDAHRSALSFASRFDLTYNAAHALALTALRLRGYRSDRRYLVFQCLVHTIGLSKTQVRLFALCHERRNLAEYEGYMDVDEPLLAELLAATPVGNYNPDWAIAFHQGKIKHVYFVAETKGTMSTMELREIEKSKIECARKFFSRITSDQVKYEVVNSYGKLMELVS